MKRYLVFSGDQYYPEGGWEDFCGSFDDIEAAKASLIGKSDSGCCGMCWSQIVDLEKQRIVWSKYGDMVCDGSIRE